jgi:hypothetical protein
VAVVRSLGTQHACPAHTQGCLAHARATEPAAQRL